MFQASPGTRILPCEYPALKRRAIFRSTSGSGDLSGVVDGVFLSLEFEWTVGVCGNFDRWAVSCVVPCFYFAWTSTGVDSLIGRSE